MEQKKQACALLIKNCTLIQPNFTILSDAAIAIDDTRIVEIGSNELLQQKYEAGDTIDGNGKLAMPGMYDCHTHTPQQLLKGGTADEPPIVWRRILLPYEANMNEEDQYHAARLYCLQSLKAGVTMFAESGSMMKMLGAVRAAQETGIRAAIARAGRSMDKALPENMCEGDPYKNLDDMIDLYETYHGSADGRIHIWFSLSSPMTTEPELAKIVAQAAKKYDTHIHCHLCEHPAEVQYCLEHFKVRPPQYFDDCGVLGPNLIAAHCIRTTDFDIRLMAERGIHVIHCPTSNLSSQGIPKLLAERAAGLNIALGNDGAAGAKQDIFFQMQLLKYVTQVVQGTPDFEPVVLPMKEAFEMMTRNGARALGVEEDLGTLEAGKKADMILMHIHEANYLPSRNLLNTFMMVAGAQDVSDVVIDGEIIMKNRCFVKINEEEILRSGIEQSKKLLARTALA